MLVLCAVVILGNNRPRSVDDISNMAELSGVFVPIPTCAFTCEINKTIIDNKYVFMPKIIKFDCKLRNVDSKSATMIIDKI